MRPPDRCRACHDLSSRQVETEPERPRFAFLRPQSGEHDAQALLERSKHVSHRLREAFEG